MTDKFQLDKKFQDLPEYAQVCASEVLRNVLSSQGVDADASYSENIGRCIKKAFIALFEGESSAVKTGIHIGDGESYPGEALKRLVRDATNIDTAYTLDLLRKGELIERRYNDSKKTQNPSR